MFFLPKIINFAKKKYMIINVGVFCASSSKINKIYFDAAEKFGKILAENNLVCFTGAGNSGLMRTIQDSVLQNGGLCFGVIPQFMTDVGWCHLGLSETIVVKTMMERKAVLREKIDAAVFLAGGIGTLDEFFEILTLKQLGIFCKPIIILNTNSYYNELLKVLEKTVSENFMLEEHKRMWQVVNSVDEILPAIAAAPDWKNENIKLALLE